MKTPLTIFISVALVSVAYCDGFIYARHNFVESEEKKLVLIIPVKKIPITDIIFRPDTEDSAIFWLEFHMREYRDSGDYMYKFEPVLKEKNVKNQNFVVRISRIHEKGCKWALRVDRLEKGRKALSEAAKSYGLDAIHAQDKTKGLQDDGGSRGDN